VPDPQLSVDLHNESHVQHVLDDIRVAEELAVRYGDRMAGYRLIETFGIVSRHGGVKDRDVGRRSRRRCLATLFTTIATTHRVAVSDVERLRPRLAERGFDLPVSIPVGLVLVFAVYRFVQWIGNRFDTDEWAGWVVATLFASLLIPGAVVAAGGAWAAVVEIVRLGNEHVAERARLEGLHVHMLVVLGVGIAAVWIGGGIAAIRKRFDESAGKVAGRDIEEPDGNAPMHTFAAGRRPAPNSSGETATPEASTE
jgi:hypothetical protein